MGMGLNRCEFIGNLGADPEERKTDSGLTVTNFRMGCGERRKQGEEWVDHTEWVRVVAWGKTAENAAKYLKKGRQVFVEGKMRTRSYKDKEGVEKWSTEVSADKVIFLGSGEGKAKEGGGSPGSMYDDQIPF